MISDNENLTNNCEYLSRNVIWVKDNIILSDDAKKDLIAGI